MTPSRPALYPEQVGLLVFSLLAVAGGIYVAVRLAFG